MDFVTAIKTVFRKFATFSGRAERPEYWWFILFYLICWVVATVVDSAILRSDASPLSSIVALVLLLPSLGVTVRRLHDIDRSGWWILVNLIPLIGLILMIYWTVKPGTPGTNRFG